MQGRVYRPPNYSGMFALGVLVMLGLFVLYVKRSSLDFLYHRTGWALIIIVFTIHLFLSCSLLLLKAFLMIPHLSLTYHVQFGIAPLLFSVWIIFGFIEESNEEDK